ncbi:hypothetical protein [Myroides odoratus]
MRITHHLCIVISWCPQGEQFSATAAGSAQNSMEQAVPKLTPN